MEIRLFPIIGIAITVVLITISGCGDKESIVNSSNIDKATIEYY